MPVSGSFRKGQAMPIYEYQCDSCGANFDALQKLSDAPLKECRQCGADGVRKLLSAPAFRLKGGGWYETDFKSKNQRNLAKGDSTKSDSAKSDSGKSDSAGGNKLNASGSDSSKPAPAASK